MQWESLDFLSQCLIHSVVKGQVFQVILIGSRLCWSLVERMKSRVRTATMIRICNPFQSPKLLLELVIWVVGFQNLGELWLILGVCNREWGSRSREILGQELGRFGLKRRYEGTW